MNHLINFFYNYFIDEKNDGYLLLCSGICLQVCNGLYEKFVMDSIMPIEMIPEEQKLKYWTQAKRFYTDTEKRMSASRAAYVLETITGKND